MSPYSTGAAAVLYTRRRREDRRLPAHPAAAILRPHARGRAGRTDDPDDGAALARLRRRPIEYFKMFYGDTALFGAWHAMQSGLELFGADHVLFGTDMPFDPEKGPGFIRDTIAAMERLTISNADKAKIYEGNARRMLRLRGV
jgi:predicted TIM-barrel fold metal-dependent hydrolase